MKKISIVLSVLLVLLLLSACGGKAQATAPDTANVVSETMAMETVAETEVVIETTEAEPTVAETEAEPEPDPKDINSYLLPLSQAPSSAISTKYLSFEPDEYLGRYFDLDGYLGIYGFTLESVEAGYDRYDGKDHIGVDDKLIPEHNITLKYVSSLSDDEWFEFYIKGYYCSDDDIEKVRDIGLYGSDFGYSPLITSCHLHHYYVDYEGNEQRSCYDFSTNLFRAAAQNQISKAIRSLLNGKISYLNEFNTGEWFVTDYLCLPSFAVSFVIPIVAENYQSAGKITQVYPRQVDGFYDCNSLLEDICIVSLWCLWR